MISTMTSDWERKKREIGSQLLQELYREGMLRTWLRDRPEGWEIVSGRWSPYYFMMRDAPSKPHVFRTVVNAAAALLTECVPTANRIIGLAATGIPIAAAVAYELGMPMGFNRKLPNVRSLEQLEKEVHRYGGHRLVEGDFTSTDRIVLLDDVVSHFDSKEIAMRQIELELKTRGVEGAQIEAVAVLVDRGHEAVDRAKAAGTRLERLVVLGNDCSVMLEGIASPRELEIIQDYVWNPEKYQDVSIKDELIAEAREVRTKQQQR
jgi:orotate phosphoribosyltransferase